MTACIGLTIVMKNTNKTTKNAAFGVVMALQLSMAGWAVSGAVNDRLKAIVTCLVSLLEFAATALVFTGGLLTANGMTETGKTVGKQAPQLMLAAVIVPLAVELYDAVAMPIYKQIKQGKANGQSMKTILITLLLTPILVAAKLAKIKSTSPALRLAADKRDL